MTPQDPTPPDETPGQPSDQPSTPSWGTPPPPPPGPGAPQQAWGSPPPGSVPPGPGGAWTPGVFPAPTTTNQKAMWSMILGILSLVCCGVFTAVPALILSPMAKKEIAASQGRETGEGMATAGLVLGIVGVCLSVLGIIFFVVGLASGSSTS